MEKTEQSYNMTYSQMAELQNLNRRLGELSDMIPEMCQKNMSKLSLGFNLGQLNVGRKKKQYIGKWKDEDMNNYINLYIERENNKLNYLNK